MGSNAVLQTALTDPETGKISATGRMVAGFGAGVLEALVIVTPFEVGIPVLLWTLLKSLGLKPPVSRKSIHTTSMAISM